MNLDEFACFNQQLAVLLKNGVPLEGALHQLSAQFHDRRLRIELDRLGEDLALGLPLPEALAARRLPDFYRRMVSLGVAGADLPGMLTLLGDHYQRSHLLWSRLRLLLVYPFLVLAAAFGLSLLLGGLVFNFLATFGPVFTNLGCYDQNSTVATTLLIITTCLPPVLVGLLALAAGTVWVVPSWRARLRWWLPAAHDASLAELAESMTLMLRQGANLADCLHLAGELEAGTRAAPELRVWGERLAAGRGRFTDFASPGRAFPRMYVWLIGNSGLDLAGGFQSAAEVYQARASQRADQLLQSTLPAAVVGLGLMLLAQLLPLAPIIVHHLTLYLGFST